MLNLSNLEQSIQQITKIDGFAIGAAATPGEYYTFVKELFDLAPEIILPQLQAISHPIAQFTYLLCKYKVDPSQKIPIPWELLRNATIISFQPFGCAKKKTTLGVIVWLHLLNMNYLGLFNFLTPPSTRSNPDTIIFKELPLYSMDQLKIMAFTLLLSDPPTELLAKIIDWLKETDDVYGYLENEPDTLIKMWNTSPVNLSMEEIQRIIQILVKNYPNPEIFDHSLAQIK